MCFTCSNDVILQDTWIRLNLLRPCASTLQAKRSLILKVSRILGATRFGKRPRKTAIEPVNLKSICKPQ